MGGDYKEFKDGWGKVEVTAYWDKSFADDIFDELGFRSISFEREDDRLSLDIIAFIEIFVWFKSLLKTDEQKDMFEKLMGVK